MLKSIGSICFLAAMSILVAGCRHHQPVVPATPPPAILSPAPSASIKVSPDSVQRGQTAQLTWNSQNASDVSIDGIGSVAGSGSRQVTAAESTTYHLLAKGSGGSSEATARLTVTPVPEPKRAALSDEELFAQNMKDIFFGYDKAEIRADEKSVLDADAQFLAAHPDWQLTIEGHCDERGSEDYNMALGQNRAKQVMEALVRDGVNGNAVKLISLGKERPFCTSANNESCWSQNRRAHFVLQKKESASMN
jgi:peptidoglycan-associated lipoprotein